MPPLPDFHLHLDVMALIVILAVGWWWAEKRIRPLVAPQAPPATAGQRRAWYWGVAVMFLAAGYPMHDLAEETLISLHMLEHMLIGYVVPPLLLIGLPRWMAEATIAHPRIVGVVRHFVTPVVGLVTFNIAVVAIHWPEAIAWQNTTEWAHFAVHVVFFLTAMSMWIPIFSPTPALPRLNRPGQMMYLFLGTIVPIVPASFLTFGSSQLYPVYGDAALAWGLTPIEDQTIAGLIMKLGGGFYLIALIANIWFRWMGEERTLDRLERELV